MNQPVKSWTKYSYYEFKESDISGTLREQGGDYGGGSETLTMFYNMIRSDNYGESNVSSTLAARDYKSPSDLVIEDDNVQFHNGQLHENRGGCA